MDSVSKAFVFHAMMGVLVLGTKKTLYFTDSDLNGCSMFLKSALNEVIAPAYLLAEGDKPASNTLEMKDKSNILKLHILLAVTDFIHV